MSVVVERRGLSPSREKSFEDICNEFLQCDTSQPATPHFNAAAQLSNDRSLFIDIQQWTFPASPRLLVSDVQSPRAIRPYGTPMGNEKSPAPAEECYFSYRPNSVSSEAPTISENPNTSWLEPQYTFDAPYALPAFPIPPVHGNDSHFDFNSITESSNFTDTPSSFDLAESQPYSPVDTQFENRNRKRKINLNEPMRIKQYGEASQDNGGVMIEWDNPIQRRSPMDKKRKEGYRDTRNKGACIHCRRGRRRCDRSCFPYIDCLTSKTLIFLDRPVDVRLFRLRPNAGHPLASEKAEIYTLADVSSSPYTIGGQISQGFAKPLRVQLSEFMPRPDFKTAHTYVSPTKGLQRHELPLLCLSSIAVTTLALEAYIRSSWYLVLQCIILDADPVTQAVLQEAQRYSINRSGGSMCLVHRALMLLAVNRMIELDWAFIDEDGPGVQVVDDEESPWFARRPITPVMDAQLDQIIIQTFLMPLRDGLLRDLQKKMTNGKEQDWFELFLTIFILQTNVALLLRHSRNNAIRYGTHRRYNSLVLAQEYIHGSNILLAHFHHGCNGRAGFLRISTGSTSGGIALDQDNFLRRLVPTVHAQKPHLIKIRHEKQYEADMFWTHQIFFDGWIPEDKTVAELER